MVTPSGDPVLRSHVTITCFTIVGNVAFIGGVVDRSSGIGAPPGTEGYITVVDNGEGDNSGGPDRVRQDAAGLQPDVEVGEDSTPPSTEPMMTARHVSWRMLSPRPR